MSTVAKSNRAFVITPDDHGNIGELGPSSTGGVGTIVIQFAPRLGFVGSFAILGKAYGSAAVNAPFLPLPYRRVNVANSASDYTMVSDVVADTGIIQVPANGLSVGLLIACTAGQCDVYVWDLDGSSAV